MNESLKELVKRFLQVRRHRKMWEKIVGSLAVVVVFITSYMLILPAITMEKTTYCGNTHHTHTASCYEPSEEILDEDDISGSTGSASAGISALSWADSLSIEGIEELRTGGEDEGLAGAETESESESESESETESESESESESKIESESETESESEFESESESETDIESEHASAIAPESESESKSESGSEPETESETESEFESESESESETGSAKKMVVRAEKKSETETATEAETKAEEGTEAESEAFTEATTESEAMTETTAELESDTETENVPETESEINPLEGMALYDEDIMDEGIAVQSAEGTLPVTSITGSGTTYLPGENAYESELKVKFKIATAEITGSGQYEYRYTYPAGVVVPSELLGSDKILKDDNQNPAGNYVFEKNADGTYSVIVKFAPQYVADAGENISGYVGFWGKLDASKIQDDGSIKSIGSDGTTLVIPADEIKYDDKETNKYDINIAKRGSYVSQDGDKLEYTVTVSSIKGTPDPIKYNDTITIKYNDTINSNDLTLNKPTVISVKKKIIKCYATWSEGSGEDPTDVEVTSEISDNSISMDLPGITPVPGKSDSKGSYTETYAYEITYTYDISDLPDGTFKTENKASVSAKDDKTHQEVKDEAKADITISNEHSNRKAGSYDKETGRIKWTIVINENQRDIAGTLVTDTMLGEIANGTDIEVTPKEGYQFKEGNGRITGIEFTAVDGTKNKNKYEIIYYTEANSSWDATKVTNTATFDPTPGQPDSGDEIKDSTTVDVPGSSVSKTKENATVDADGKTATVEWKATLNVATSGIPAGTIITDSMDADSSAKRMYMTRQQILDWNGILTWNDKTTIKVFDNTSDYEVTFRGEDGKTYSLAEVRALTSDEVFLGFSVKFLKELKLGQHQNQLVLSYNSTADLETGTVIGDNKYHNKITFGNKESSADYTFKKGGVIKTDGNGKTEDTTVSNTNGALMWKVRVTIGEKWNTPPKTLTITDTLPEGVHLDKIICVDWANGINISVDENTGKVSGGDNSCVVGGSYNRESGEITFTVKKSEYNSFDPRGTYEFDFHCVVNDDILQKQENGVKYEFTNHANAKVDGVDYGSPSQKQEWTKTTTTVETKVVDKTGNWDNDNRLAEYTIVLNPEAKDLVENSEFLTLTDVLEHPQKYTAYLVNKGDPYTADMEFTLLQNKVRLYEAVKAADGNWTTGAEISDWKWTYSSENTTWGTVKHTIKATNIPDGKALILKYVYKVSAEIPRGYAHNLQEIKNTAELNGTGNKDNTSLSNQKWEDQGSTGGVTTVKNYTIYKVEKGNFGTVLPGAVFTLYKYQANAENEWAKVKTYTTDANGKIVITKPENGAGDYEDNVLYMLKETTPPKGYLLDEKVPEYCFYFSNAESTNKLPKEEILGQKGAVDLSKTSKESYVENKSNTTEITVDKKWLNKDGSMMNKPSGKIQVKLYQKSSTIKPGEAIPQSVIKTNLGKVGDVKLDYPIGTTITYQLAYKWANYKNQSISVTENGNPVVVSEMLGELQKPDWRKYQYKYFTFSVVLQKNTVINVQGYDPESDWSGELLSVTLPLISKDVEYGTYEIEESSNWQKKITGLPLTGKNNDGETVYYSYYIEEVPVPNYTTSYENNGGITSGTITITNQSTENPSYTLPATGGSGTLPYMAGGIAVLASGLLYGYSLRRRRERRMG